MDFSVDRKLPMPVRQQLKGSIEFGIAFGELLVGAALPSVREMAQLAGVAPMTVSQVYRELKDEGLIETRPGSGTFVADSSQARAVQRGDIDELHRRIDSVIDHADAIGVSPPDFVALVNARLAYRRREGRRVHLVVVGLFPDATQSYVDFIAERLDQNIDVEPVTLMDLRQTPELCIRAGSADLVVTFTNRHGEVSALLPAAKVVTIRYIPSERTRMLLAAIDPVARVLVLSRFPDFLPIFRAAVQRFAPHVHEMTAINFDDPTAPGLLADCDVVVYATGTESMADLARPGAQKFEYRHIPDPTDVDRVLLPLIRKAAAGRGLEKDLS